MTSRDSKNVAGRMKRLPFVDKTNCINQERSETALSNNISPTKNIIEYFTSIDPKFNLQLNVHLKPCNTAIKELSDTLTYPNSKNSIVERIVSSDSKFGINPKVRLKKFNITNVMPNLRSTNVFNDENVPKNKEIFTKSSLYDVSSTNSDLKTDGDAIKKHSHNCLLDIEINVPKHNDVKNIKRIETDHKKSNLDPKFYREVIVQVYRCKELEEALQAKKKSEQIVKNVQFKEDENQLLKFNKTLRNRRTKNYAELSFKDSLSPQQNTNHVPVYLQHKVIAQKQKETDPFEFQSESFTQDQKKKRRKGRPRKEILSPLQVKKKKKGRPTKEENSDSDSSFYDKSMHKILKKVRHKLSPKKCKYRKLGGDFSIEGNSNSKPITNHVQIAQKRVISHRVRKEEGGTVWNTKVNSSPSKVQKQAILSVAQQNISEVSVKKVNDIASNIEKVDLSRSTKNGKTSDLFTQEVEIISRGISKNPSQNNVETVSVKDDCGTYFGFDEDYEDDDGIPEVTFTPRGSTESARLLDINPVNFCRKFTSLTSTPLPHIQSQKVTNKTKKINIISDILVSSPCRTRSMTRVQQGILKTTTPSAGEKSMSSLASKTPVVENGQSRLLNLISKPLFVEDNEISNTAVGFDNSVEKLMKYQTRSSKLDSSGIGSTSNRSFSQHVGIKRQSLNQSSLPWRVDDLCIKRNPHYLVVKNTSLLPCYNQEMVLEPKLLERPVTPLHTEKIQGNKVQKSILDYVSSNKMNSESRSTKNSHDKTLFDENEFSPIKSQKSHNNSSSEENSMNENGAKLTLQNTKTRKNIFKIQTKKNSASPLRISNEQNISSELNKKFDVKNYFGFDSFEDRCAVGKENIKVKRKRAAHEKALPMRLPIKQLKKVREEAIEELLSKVILPAEENLAQELTIQEPVESNSQNQEQHLGLFEDLEETKPPTRIYSRKRTKRVRIASVDTDGVEEEKPKRKRKDMPTAAEEEEFNKWATAFNAMCNEIENYNLDVE